MKKKIYFIISSVIQIVIGAIAIINADKIIEQTLSGLEMYSEGMQDRITSLYSNSGHLIIIFMAAIGILLNGLIIYWAISNKLLKKKGSVIGCSIYSFIMSFSALMQLFAIINVVVMLSCKRVKKEDFPEEKKKMPKLDKEKVTKEKIILSVILIVIYFSFFIIDRSIQIPDNISKYVSICFYLTMIVLSILFFKDLLKDNFKVFRENLKAYFQNLIGVVGKYYLVFLGISMIMTLLFKLDVSNNQTSVESLPIWFLMPLAIIYAPIVEETIFRGCIRRFIKNDKVFIIVSGLLFGLVHTLFSEVSLYNVIIQAIPYMVMGGFLAYLYVKTNNICTNMAFHAFHNTLATIMSILIAGLINM